jgi:hypothetical protein
MARNRIKAKGRSETGFFVAMPKTILESEEYAGLSAHEVKLLIDLYAQYNGRNNGDFNCTWSLMEKRGWHSEDTLHRALKGLIEHGWIIRTRQGGKNRCSLYAVTWLRIDECGGKHDQRATVTAPGTWKNKTVLREPEHITTGAVAVMGMRHAN